ncbi:LPS biosynthesis glycosyltransferase [Lyngbya aestuarii]|uniref:LPS biosynthesis glycosyltransferase n=1 Tax=Lyngbya aestuarii TaxID=118322 RepID=UPI00403DFE39
MKFNLVTSIIKTITSQVNSSSQLVNCLGKVFIIAHQESTELLEEYLTQEGFAWEVLRQEERAEFKNLSSSYLCLLNHQKAWEKASSESKPTLIVEADFVPVQGLGKLPLPFDATGSDVGISWLYTCAAQLYTVSKDGYAQGFSTAMVAYILTNQSANSLLEYAKLIQEKWEPTDYLAWDSDIDAFLLAKKLKNYIPFRNYGEHGGQPNPEHQQNGLSKTHRADVLYGRLAFLPLYASVVKHSQLKLFCVRLQARLKGIARLLTGRFLRLPVLKGSSFPVRLLIFAVTRHFFAIL